MNTQEKNAKLLNDLFAKSGITMSGDWDHHKLKSDGYMDLAIDYLYMDGSGGHHLALAHNGIQNGDVMADPDMEIAFYTNVEPNYVVAIHYQNDYMGYFASLDHGNTTQAQLDDFLATWLTNLLEQGHVLPEGEATNG